MVTTSHHESINESYEKIHADGVTTVFDRYESQKRKCGFCEKGLSCVLCSMGPCRLSEKAPLGACGIDANGMAMRNMLHRNIMGTTAYAYHANEAFKTLKLTAEGKTPYDIKDPEKLKAFASQLGIDTERDVKEIAIDLADFLLEELKMDSDEESKLVETMAPGGRKDLWRKLGIFPGGAYKEAVDNAAASMTNVDTDFVSLAKKAMRMGISTAYTAQMPLEVVQDILFGTPAPHMSKVDLGIIDPAYVNIAVNGHEPFVGAELIRLARQEKYQEMAREAGAKGLRIVGSIETGQELQQRFEVDDVFVGMTGNWISQEFALATGGIDVFAADMNCTLPTLAAYEDRYTTTIVPVSKLVRIKGIKDYGLDYDPTKVTEQAEELIRLAIENFKKREGKGVHVTERRQDAMVGFSIESILQALGGSLDPLLDAIKSGQIKGVTALVSCSTLKNGPQDSMTVEVARELIKRDILVLGMGCGNAALQVAGLESLEAQELAGDGLKAVCKALGVPPVLSFGTCTDTGRLAQLITAVADALGVDVPALPIAATAPEYMEQKATIDALFAVAFGVYTHVAPLPPVSGGAELVKLLTQDVEDITGGKLAVEADARAAADGIEAHILEKRKALGI